MRVWIESLRLSVCMLASFLAVTGYVLAGIDISWPAIAAVFFITCTTMLQNDWRDRFHDVQKGKVLASERERPFLAVLMAFWIASGGLIIWIAIQNERLGAVLVMLAVAGAVYSETRLIPLFPIVIVSLTSAAPTVLPLTEGTRPEKLLLLFVSAALIVFAREITKDLDDLQIDRGYKWTIPLTCGERPARTIAVFAIVLGVVTAAQLSLVILPAASLAVVAATMLVRGVNPALSRKYLDVGMVLVMFSLLAFR